MMTKWKKILALYPYRKKDLEVKFFPPIGLEYIVASIKNLVEKVRIVDYRFDGKKQVKELIDDAEAVLISLNWAPAKRFKARVPEYELINAIPADRTIIVGGRFATENMEEVFTRCPNVNFLVRGAGEETIKELFIAGAAEDVAGISYRKDNRIVHNPPRPLEPLSNELFPERQLRRYKYEVCSRGINFGITIDGVLSSRGCPYNCTFCTYNLDGDGRRRPWEPRTPESVVREIKEVDAEVIYFLDNNFCVNLERVEKICNLLLKEKINKTLIAETRIELCRSPELLEKMRQAGFKILLFGIESACDKSLAFLNKGFTVAQVREAFKIMRKFDFILGGYFILGNIGETEEEMKLIPDFARELGVDVIILSYLRAEQGSLLEHIIKDMPDYWIDPEDKYRVFSRTYGTTELRRIKSEIQHKFWTLGHILRLAIKLSRLRTIKLHHLLKTLISFISLQPGRIKSLFIK